MEKKRRNVEKQERKRLKGWKKAAVILGSVLLVILAAWLGLRAAFFRFFAPGPSNDYELYGSHIPIAEKDPIDPSVRNYLLIGTDSRFSHGSPMEGNSDTIIVATYNVRDKVYDLTSIMRDSYVHVSGLETEEGVYRDKLKGAFRLGGIGCLINTINDTFHLDIQKYVVIGLEGFIRVVDDVLGGIDVELTASDIAFINSRINDYENESDLVKNAPLIRQKPGKVHLTGAQSLIYIRNRSTSYSGEDFERFTMKSHVQKLTHTNLLSAIADAHEKGLLPDPQGDEELRLARRYRMIGTVKESLVRACAKAVEEHPLLSGESGGSEYDRSARQQALLKVIYRKFLDTWTVSDIPGILRICSDTIETNLSPEEIIALAMPLLEHEREIHTYSVPFEGTWHYGSDGSGIRFDREKTAQMLHEVLYE